MPIAGGVADRRRLMELAYIGAHQRGFPATEALCELLNVVERVLGSMADGPIQVHMAAGDKQVQELRALMATQYPPLSPEQQQEYDRASEQA